MYLHMYGKRKKNRFRISKRGFTLIELLLALAIFSIVASVIYSSFRLGIISWRRTEANLSKYQRIRYAINSLSEDIANAFLYKKIPFKGEEKRVEFAGFIKDIDTKERTIGRISYEFFAPETRGPSGKLIRQKLFYWQAVTAEGEEETTESGREFTKASEELLSDVIDFSINYCYKMSEEKTATLEWLPEWVSEESIPAGIKIELVLKDDYAPGGSRVFTKRIHIPVGAIGNLEELSL